MGQRLSYFKNNFDKGLKDLIVENFVEFRQWYLDYDKSSMVEFNEPFGSEKLKVYFRKKTDFKSEFDKLDKKLIDEVTSEFIGTYYDLTHHENECLEFFGPSMSIWRYEESNKMILATKDIQLLKLWNFIIKGRSIADNLEFNSYTNEYKIGFLSRQECYLLKNKIEQYFGDIETIRLKYWTKKERVQLENAIAENSYSLTGHNPKSSGLEYVLTAINELNEHNKELIAGIE
jgi:hypothetical protein